MDSIEKKRLQWYGHVKRMLEERIPKLIMEWTDRKKEKRTAKKNADRGSTSSHDNKELGTKSVETQRGMEFGLWKTATAVMKLDR